MNGYGINVDHNDIQNPGFCIVIKTKGQAVKVTLNKYVKIFCHRPKNQAFYSFVNLFNSIVVNLMKYCSLITTFLTEKPHGITKVRIRILTCK
jgi:hypothetical protein